MYLARPPTWISVTVSKKIWNKAIKEGNSVQRWNNKLSALRRYLRGCASHTTRVYKQEKAELQSTINNLIIAAEVRDLTESKRVHLAHSRNQLTKLLREEEIKYYQKDKVKDVLLDDNNTRYFQMVANARVGKKIIFSLDHDNGKVEGKTDLKYFITRGWMPYSGRV